MKSILRRRIRRAVARLTGPFTGAHLEKVFCVGWLKTGTTSFGHAMRRLGFRHMSYDPDVVAWFRAGKLDKVLRLANCFDSFDDLPWNRNLMLDHLDRQFPGSRFVLLTREEEEWLRSFLRYAERQGRPIPDPKASLDVFRNHNRKVLRHFEGRDDLLVMRITEGEGYERLCPFLGLAAPAEPFPHANRGRAPQSDE